MAFLYWGEVTVAILYSDILKFYVDNYMHLAFSRRKTKK